MKKYLLALAIVCLASPLAAGQVAPIFTYDTATKILSLRYLPGGLASNFALYDPTGGTFSLTPTSLLVKNFQAGVPGALFDGVTNDVAAINTAITAARAAGGGTIILPSATTHIGSPGIILKSYVRLLGQNGTTIVCDTSPCVTQTSGAQLLRAKLGEITFVAGSGQSAATVMAFPTILYSDIGPLRFKGFTAGKALSIIGAVASTFDESALSSNTIFNDFHDWTGYEDGFANPIEIRGAYGGAPPVPSQVATINKIHRMSFKFTSATAGCINLISGTDSNSFEDILCLASGTGTKTYIYQSNDATYSTVPNYVNANTFTRMIFSVDPGSTVTDVTFFGGYFNHATMVYGLTHDINQASRTITVDGGTLTQSICIFGGQAAGGPGLHTGSGNVFLESFCTGRAWDKRTVFNTPTTGATILGATTQGYDQLHLQNASNIATLTVRWPCAPRDGQSFTIGSQLAGVDALTMATCESGAAMSTAVGRNPFRMVKGSAYTFRYLSISNTWIQHTTNTSGGPIEGITNGAGAAAGDVGQRLTSNIVLGSAVALTTGAAANVTSVSLTAGDWRCGGDIAFNPAGTTTQTKIAGGLSTTTAVLPTDGTNGKFNLPVTLTTGVGSSMPVGMADFNVSATTTLFLVALADFGASTNAAYGNLGCIRVR